MELVLNIGEETCRGVQVFLPGEVRVQLQTQPLLSAPKLRTGQATLSCSYMSSFLTRSTWLRLFALAYVLSRASVCSFGPNACCVGTITQQQSTAVGELWTPTRAALPRDDSSCCRRRRPRERRTGLNMAPSYRDSAEVRGSGTGCSCVWLVAFVARLTSTRYLIPGVCFVNYFQTVHTAHCYS